MLPDRQSLASKTMIYLALALIVIVLGGFMLVHHLRSANTPVATTQLPTSGGPFGSVGTTVPSTSDCGSAPPLMLNVNGQTVQTCSQPTNGSVTAVNASSLTVAVSGASPQTFSITSSTVITHKGQTLSATDIAVGDTVSVIASPSDATQAHYILVNPTFQSAQ